MLSVGIFLLCAAALGNAWWLFSKARKTRSKASANMLRRKALLLALLSLVLGIAGIVQWASSVTPHIPTRTEQLAQLDPLPPADFGLPLEAKEVPERRTEHTVTYKVGDNNYATVSQGTPLFTHDENGLLVPTKNTGKRQGNTIVFDRLASDVDIVFHLDRPQYELRQGDHFFNVTYNLATQGTFIAPATISYPLADGATLTWTVIGNRVKEAIRIERPLTAPLPSFNITPSANLRMESTESSITMHHSIANGQVIFNFSSPILLNASGTHLDHAISFQKTGSDFLYQYNENGLPLPYVIDPSSGPNSPASAANVSPGPGNNAIGSWGNTTNIFASDEMYSISAAETVSALTDDGAMLTVGGFRVGTSKHTNTALSATTTNQTYSYGGPSDLWDTTLSASEVNAPDFGFAFAAESTGGSGTHWLYATGFSFAVPDSTTINGVAVEVEWGQTAASASKYARVDHIRMTVYYTEIIAPSVSGTLYSDRGITPLAGKLVAVSVNGGPRKGSGYTLAGGLYKANLTGATMTGGTIVTVYLENETEDAVTVTLGSGSSMTGINLFQNYLIARSDSGSVALTNTHLNIAAANGASDISAIYSVSGNNLTLASGKRMMIRSGNTFTLGGSLTADYLHVDGTFTQDANAVTVSQFTQSGGTFTGGSAAMDVNGAFVVEGGTFTQGTSTLNISGNTHIAAAATFTKSNNGSALILDGDLSLSTPGRPDLGNLQIGASPDTTTLESDLVATNVTVGTGDLLITDGYEINASGGFFLHGSLDATSGTDGVSTLTLSGAWMMAGGGFTAGASTVLLDGANQRFFGSTSFYNLTKTVTTADTLTFPSGYTQAITNALTLQGAAGQLLSLRATTGGQAAGINPSGSRTVQYLDVQDNWNTNVTAISCLSSCTDSGGNTHWFFGEGSGAPPSASNNYLLAPDVQPAGGGEEAKSDLYVLYDTIGEGNIGESTSDSYTLDAGYRQQDAEITISMDCTASVGLGTLTRTGDTSVNTCAQTGYCTTNKTTCEVITNNPTGYTLSWAVTTGTGAAGARTGTGYLNGYVAGHRIAPLGTGSTTQSMQPIAMTAGAGTVNNDARWAARLSSTSTTVGGASIDWGSDGLSDTWLRVATGASVNIANRGSAAVGDTQNIGFRAIIHGTAIVPSDTYKATVTITAITN